MPGGRHALNDYTRILKGRFLHHRLIFFPFKCHPVIYVGVHIQLHPFRQQPPPATSSASGCAQEKVGEKCNAFIGTARFMVLEGRTPGILYPLDTVQRTEDSVIIAVG